MCADLSTNDIAYVAGSVPQRTDYVRNCAYDRSSTPSLKISADEFANSRPVGATEFTWEIVCKPND